MEPQHPPNGTVSLASLLGPQIFVGSNYIRIGNAIEYYTQDAAMVKQQIEKEKLS